MRWVLASNNAGKLRELSALLTDWDIQPQGAFFNDEAEETGLSFIENALIKARFAAAKTGLAAIADDSGLEVAALQGAPGIYSARYAGAQATDAQNNAALLQAMAHLVGEQRQACYYCALVAVRHANDPTPMIGLGRWCGRILTVPRGEGGFGYDPLMYFDDLQASAAELEPTVKNQRSHRAQALRALVAQLQSGRTV